MPHAAPHRWSRGWHKPFVAACAVAGLVLGAAALLDVAGVPDHFLAVPATVIAAVVTALLIRWTMRGHVDSKQLAETLRERERTLAVLLESTVEGVLVWNDAGINLDVNDAAGAIFGLSRTELEGMSVRKLSIEVAGGISEEALRTFRARGILQRVWTVHRPDGTSCEVETFSLANFLPGKHLTVLRDMTEQREATEATRLRAESLQGLLREARDAIVVMDPTGRHLAVNDAMCELFGRSREELMAAPAGSFTVEGSGNVTEEEGRLFAAGSPLHKTWTIVRPDGETRSADGLSIPNFLPGMHLGVLRDVTQREETAANLRAAEARYRSLAEALPLVTYMNAVDDDFTPLYVGPQLEQLVGYPAELRLGDPRFLERLLHPDDRDRVLAEVRHARAALEPLAIEYRLTARDGRVVWVLDEMVVIRDEQGEPLYYQGFLLDVTQRKQLEDQLKQSQRMEVVGQLAGGIAHDFNNLLTAISGYAGFALERMGDGDEVRADVEQVRRAAERAASLTQQLLAFSRKQVLQPRVLALASVVDGVRSLVERLIGEDVELVVEHAAGELLVEADPLGLEQVLVNLAVNARDAMPRGGALRIVTGETEVDADHPAARWGAAPGRYPSIVVTDDGVGMDDETRARVFEPFFTTKEVGKGTGLGLSTVYGIVKQSEGWIAVESEPGRGTAVTILLPPADRAGMPEPEHEEQHTRPRGSERILLVEDEEIVRTLVAEMLTRNGYDVLQAPVPDAALELARNEDFDLLVTDVVMPKMTGRELAVRLREYVPELRVLYMSGYAPEAVLDGGGLGPSEMFLQKPFSADELADHVREALEHVAAA